MTLRSLSIVLVACGHGAHSQPDSAAPPDAAIDAPTSCRAVATAGATFGASVAISDPANASFTPAIATHDGVVVIAWHDFPPGGASTRVVTTAVVDGCVGPIEPVPEPLTGGKRVTIAATAAGFVLAYDAMDGATTVVRAIDLDASGHAIGAPSTISASGTSGSVAHVAASGDDVAFAWTDGNAHYFARRGPVETVAATAVGTTLQATGLLNFPRVAVTSSGTLLIVYRDGGAQPEDWDVLVVARAVGGVFGAPVDVSNTAGLLSDDISLAIEPDDRLDLVWVDQDAANVNAFEVDHATRSAAGALSAPARFGSQGMQSWTPSVTSGLATVWSTGAAAGGPLWLADAAAPQAILPGEQGSMAALARAGDASLHLAYQSAATPRQIQYAIRRP